MISLVPKETYQRIADISLNYLINDKGIKGLIFDFDGTLWFHRELSSETLDFIKIAKKQGLKISIVSNNIYLNNSAIEDLNISIIKKFAFKPLRKPFLDMAKRMKLNPDKIAVIGNNRISDIWGANRAGMYSIYIQDLNGFFFKKSTRNKLKEIGIKNVN